MDNFKTPILGNISSIETSGFVDGPGVRVVVFLQGCNLRCLYCHNPESLNISCKKTLMSPEEVLEKIKKYKPYFGETGGVTFSGGEPLLQPKFLLEILKLCKQNNIHTCLDTSGHADNFEELMEFVDLVILDIKAVFKKDYKHLTGQQMDKFLKFLSYVQEKNKPLWIRQVIVPTINDTNDNILNLAKFISSIKNVQKVELLPYHNMAQDKYKKLNLPYKLTGIPPMDKQKCKKLEELLLKNIRN